MRAACVLRAARAAPSRRASAACGPASASGRCTSRRRRRWTSRRRRSARRSPFGSRRERRHVVQPIEIERRSGRRACRARAIRSDDPMCIAARAEPRRHRQRRRAPASPSDRRSMPLASSAASRVSSNMSRSLFDAAPSVPMPTSTPELQHSARPARRRRRASGCSSGCARRRRRQFFSARISPSSTWTQCAASTLASNSPCFLHPRHDRHAVDAARVLHFEQRLGEMRCAAARRTRRRARRRRAGFPACRCRARAAPGPGTISGWPRHRCDELARARQRVLEARRVGRRKSQHRLRAQRAHAGVGGRLGDRILEVIHVGEAGHAGANHLGAAELRAEPHELRADELALDRHHVAHQPDVEPQIVGEPAQAASSARACAR